MYSRQILRLSFITVLIFCFFIQNVVADPIHDAISSGDIKGVMRLVQEGADVNTYNSYGQASLVVACMKGNIDIVRLLIQHGAHINTRDRAGWTPLSSAITEGQLEVVRFLIGNGVDINARDEKGWTPLARAVFWKQIEIVKLLLENGANVNSRIQDGGTVLSFASRLGYLEMVRLFLKAGAAVNIKDRSGKTPLYSFSKEGNTEFVNLILAKGVDVQEHGGDALVAASEQGHVEIVTLLIEKGADIDTSDKLGRTALHFLSERGDVETIKILIEKNVDVNAIDRFGKTALEYASIKTHSEVVQLLVDAGADLISHTDETSSIYKELEKEVVDFMIDYIFGSEIDAAKELFEKNKDSRLEPPKECLLVWLPKEEHSGETSMYHIAHCDFEHPLKVWLYCDGILREKKKKNEIISEYNKKYIESNMMTDQFWPWGFYEFCITSILPSKGQSVVYFSASCGPLCGHGVILVLKRMDKLNWNIIDQILIWVS